MSNQTTLSRLRSLGGDGPTEADLRSQLYKSAGAGGA